LDFLFLFFSFFFSWFSVGPKVGNNICIQCLRNKISSRFCMMSL
jgi:hypothetical protein